MSHNHGNNFHVQLKFAGNGGVVGMTQMQAHSRQEPPLFSSQLTIYCPSCDDYLNVNILVHGQPLLGTEANLSQNTSGAPADIQVTLKKEVNDPLSSKLEVLDQLADELLAAEQESIESPLQSKKEIVSANHLARSPSGPQPSNKQSRKTTKSSVRKRSPDSFRKA